jgi:hypothetical protein
MKFLAIIYSDESLWTNATPEQVEASFAGHGALTEEGAKAGVVLGGEGLQPVATATTLRVRDGERMLTDGPYAETKEQLGGYYLFDCKDLDEALDWAARIPEAEIGAVEVRPVMDYEAVQAAAAARAEGAAS